MIGQYPACLLGSARQKAIENNKKSIKIDNLAKSQRIFNAWLHNRLKDCHVPAPWYIVHPQEWLNM